MSNNTGRLAKASFAKETTWGTYVTPTQALSPTNIGVIGKVDTTEDPRFVGNIFPSDFIKVGNTVDGPLDTTMHPEEVGPLVYYALGKQDSVSTSPKARIVVYYTGTDAFASVTVSGGVWVGKSGATQGTAVQAFSLDTSSASYDTVAELVTAINAVSNWKAYGFGLTSNASSGFSDFTEATIKTNGFSNSLIKEIASSSTTTKEHHIYPAGASDSEVSFSLCYDQTLGTSQAIGITGCKIDQMTIKSTAKTILTNTMTVSGKVASTGLTYPSVSPISDNPYVAANAQVIIGGYSSQYIKDISIQINNNLDKSTAVGSYYIMEQIRNGAMLKVSGSMNLETTEYLRQNAIYNNNTPTEMLIYIENVSYADATNNVIYSVLIRIPAGKLTKYEAPVSNPNRIVTTFEFSGMTETGYNNVEFWVVDKQTSTY